MLLSFKYYTNALERMKANLLYILLIALTYMYIHYVLLYKYACM